METQLCAYIILSIYILPKGDAVIFLDQISILNPMIYDNQWDFYNLMTFDSFGIIPDNICI